MICPKCGARSFERVNGEPPVTRNGVVLRMKQCLADGCRHKFITAELVVTNEFEPVVRLDDVLRSYMDESDARAQAEVGGAASLEAMAETEGDTHDD